MAVSKVDVFEHYKLLVQSVDRMGFGAFWRVTEKTKTIFKPGTYGRTIPISLPYTITISKERVVDLANRDVRLTLFSGLNFTGRHLIFRRGGIAVRNLGVFRFNNILSSFRLRNIVNRNEVTLVLFSGTNFRGAFRIFRGSQDVADLRRFVTSSFILVGRRLTSA